MTDQPDKIQWHPGFYGAAELEFRANSDVLTFLTEYSLSKEPLRADLLVIRKKPDVQISNEIGKIFKGHNIIEYKSPDDGLTIDDFYKTAAYACLYKASGQTVDQYPWNDITVSLFREAYPRELFAALRLSGRCIEEQFPGIYYITGSVMFDTQVVVMSQLNADGHSPLRILSRSAAKKDVQKFLLESSSLAVPGDKSNADAVLQVSISANRSLYDSLRRENFMCEALEDLMKDVIEERVNQAVKLNTEQVTERVTEQVTEQVTERVTEQVTERVTEQVTERVTEQVTERVTEQKDKEMAIKLFGRGMAMDTIVDLIGRSAEQILQWVSPASQA